MPDVTEEERLANRAKRLVYERAYRLRHRDLLNERQRLYNIAHPEKVKASNKKSRLHRSVHAKQQYRAIKQSAFDAYGGRCACCGETNSCFLTIDHINNDGNRHRSQRKATGYGIYRWLKKEGYPQGQFQVLCWNCNCSKVHSQLEHEAVHPNAKAVNGDKPALFFS